MKITAELQNYGVSDDSIRIFGGGTSPGLLDYLDLVEPRGVAASKFVVPDGAVESQGRPLVYFVNESRLAKAASEQTIQLSHLRRNLACRGNRAYLAIVRPGVLTVSPVSLREQAPEWKPYRAGTGEAITFFSRLAQGHFDGVGEADASDFVFREMFKLLQAGADRIAHRIGRADVLSLIGRALFFRFLCDRSIVTEDDTKRIASGATELQACFDNAENAYETSQWLDRTFNGDFLPLRDGGSRAFFEEIATRSKIVYQNLKAILRGWEPMGADDYQIKLKWSDFNFAHVPIGLLSQVYEAFCWKWEHHTAEQTSVHYTPRNIAWTLVDEVFDELPKKHECRILDPACGAGVFLVLAFRRLYRERWQAAGERPGTRIIREILERQLVGLDISDSALRLSALSLYLTAIELDPKPLPPEKLRFKALTNLVLFNSRRDQIDPVDGPVIGSLGPHIGNQFDDQFDLVLSNPPWTSLARQESSLATELATVSKAVIERKGEPALATEYQNPDFAPDLPFLWKATEWCKAGGHIAMALPARILLKQKKIPRQARETLFRLIEVTGIINGSNLADTDVWPGMSQPFILLFARNRRPSSGHVVRFISSHFDSMLNRRGELRIDSKSAETIEIQATIDEPWIWKTLAVGTVLDVEVVRRVKNAPGRLLLEYWKTDLNLESGKGYQVVEKGKQRDARFLKGLPNLDVTDLFRFQVRPERLDEFNRDTVMWPRKKEIYQAPLVLVKESPGVDRSLGWALLSFENIAYNESFCGYSASGYPESNLLIRYLHLFVHSSIWLHYALMTSAKFGAERRRFYKADLDDCPIIPLDRLSADQRQQIRVLSDRLIAEDVGVFEDIDSFVGNLYCLSGLDLEVIRDTLEVSLPYDASRKYACGAPTRQQFEIFRHRLESILRPFFEVIGKEVRVSMHLSDDSLLQAKTPFAIVSIGKQSSEPVSLDSSLHRLLLELANDTGATQIVQKIDGGLVIGLLNQLRYWTPSRARLLGAGIVRRHMSIFED